MHARRTDCTEEESLDDMLLDVQPIEKILSPSKNSDNLLQDDSLGRCRSNFSKMFSLNELKNALPEIDEEYQHMRSADTKTISSGF